LDIKEAPIKLFIDKTTSHHLPEYLLNMLLACGYDRLETIAEMDVNDDSGKPNDIDKMIEYVKQNFPSDAR